MLRTRLPLASFPKEADVGGRCLELNRTMKLEEMEDAGYGNSLLS